MSTPTFKIMKFLADDQDLQNLVNNHYNLVSGDAGYWEDYASSPFFPVNEQPESENFYVLYNFNDAQAYNAWWHLDTMLVLYIFSNNIKLIVDVCSRLQKLLGDYEYAADRINEWSLENNVDGPVINWTRYAAADPIMPQEQENGVYGRGIEIAVNSTVC